MVKVRYLGPEYPYDDEGRYTEYIVDSAADVASLPVGGSDAQGPRPGSMAVSPDADLWMLSNQRVWEEFGGGE